MRGDIAINVNRFNEIFHTTRPSVFDDIIKSFFVEKPSSRIMLLKKANSKKKT